MAESDSGIEITIPVLNEEATLVCQVRKVLDYINVHLQEFPAITLIIADNGSTDKTQELATALSDQETQVRYIRLNERGVGRALQASWSESKASIVGYMDLDLATDLCYLKPALWAIYSKDYDIVTGSRLAPGSKVFGRSILRATTSRVFNTLVKVYFRSSFSDGMCGFKFLDRTVLNSLREGGAKSHGWFFATELLVVADFLKLRVKDLPVQWQDDPHSKVKLFSLTIEYLKAMRALKRRLGKQRFVS